MPTMKQILMAIADLFCGLFALLTPAARRGDNKVDKRRGFNFLPVLVVVCIAAIIGGTEFANGGLLLALSMYVAAVLQPLHQAAKDGNIAEARRLIDGGANVNEEDYSSNMMPLHFAAGEGHTDTALFLIKAGADINAGYGYTPLYCAAEGGHTDTAVALIKAGANINAKTSQYGRTPLSCAVESGHTGTAVALIKAGADVNTEQSNGITPLYSAAEKGHADIAAALIEAGADVNAKDRVKSIGMSKTPLHAAIKKCHTDIALALIKAGADVNAKTDGTGSDIYSGNYTGDAPLHYAARESHTRIALALIKAGADINAESGYHAHERKTPLDCAIEAHGAYSVIALFLQGAMGQQPLKNWQQAEELLRELE